jgi:hypothetical protein
MAVGVIHQPPSAVAVCYQFDPGINPKLSVLSVSSVAKCRCSACGKASGFRV